MDPNQWLGPFSWEEELRDKAIYDASMHDVMIYPGISTSNLVFCIIVVTTIIFYNLFSIVSVPPRLENHHIWHSPRLYSTYFI